jgi:hypothetical protein
LSRHRTVGNHWTEPLLGRMITWEIEEMEVSRCRLWTLELWRFFVGEVD